MSWDLPLSVNVDGKEYAIRNKCDYRVILDTIDALEDMLLETPYRIYCALYIFYEDLTGCENLEAAVDGMLEIINLGEKIKTESVRKPIVMNWKRDFNLLAPAISRVLNYSVRDKNNYTHWYDFVGAYMEIGECAFMTVITIRLKKIRHIKLNKNEEEFYRENRQMIDLEPEFTPEEEKWFEQILAGEK